MVVSRLTEISRVIQRRVHGAGLGRSQESQGYSTKSSRVKRGSIPGPRRYKHKREGLLGETRKQINK